MKRGTEVKTTTNGRIEIFPKTLFPREKKLQVTDLV
jgi:hypothetical protein